MDKIRTEIDKVINSEDTSSKFGRIEKSLLLNIFLPIGLKIDLGISPERLFLATEDKAPALQTLVSNVAKSLNIESPIIFIVKHWHNAAEYSIGKNNSIIFIGDKEIYNDTKEELEATIAHELSHVKKQHDILCISTYATSLITLGIISYYLHRSLQNRHPLYKKTFCINIMIHFIFIRLLSSYVISKLCHHIEKEADLMAAKITNNPRALATSLLKSAGIPFKKNDNLTAILESISEIYPSLSILQSMLYFLSIPTHPTFPVGSQCWYQDLQSLHLQELYHRYIWPAWKPRPEADRE